MQVGCTVGRFYGTSFYFRQCVAFVWVPGGQEVFDLLAVFGPDQVDDARDFRSVVTVDRIFAGGADRKVMYTFQGGIRCQQGCLPLLQIQLPAVYIHRSAVIERTPYVRLGGSDKQVLAFGVETDYLGDYPFSLCQLFQLFTGGVIQIQVVVSVFLALPDEFAGIVREEEYRILRFNVMFVRFCEKDGFFLAGQGRIANQVHLILFAVQFGNIDTLFIRAPGDVGKELFFRGSGFQPDGFACREVVHTDCYLMALHAGHRIFNRFGFCLAGIDIDDRIVCDHALVHPVESQGGTCR